jgi:hypothetical protein
MFGKKSKEISLNRIHDTVTFRESDDKLTLKVYADPMRVSAGLLHVRRKMQSMDENSPDEEQEAVALEMATVIFGEDQGKQLMEFYRNDAAGVLNVCLLYFRQRLSNLIIKAQKKNARDGV